MKLSRPKGRTVKRHGVGPFVSRSPRFSPLKCCFLLIWGAQFLQLTMAGVRGSYWEHDQNFGETQGFSSGPQSRGFAQQSPTPQEQAYWPHQTEKRPICAEILTQDKMAAFSSEIDGTTQQVTGVKLVSGIVARADLTRVRSRQLHDRMLVYLNEYPKKKKAHLFFIFSTSVKTQTSQQALLDLLLSESLVESVHSSGCSLTICKMKTSNTRSRVDKL